MRFAPGDCVQRLGECVPEIGELLAATPNAGNPAFPPFLAFIGGLVGTSLAIALRRPRDDVQWAAFIGAFLGGMIGLAFLLVASLAEVES